MIAGIPVSSRYLQGNFAKFQCWNAEMLKFSTLTMKLYRAFFEILFEAVRQKILTLTEQKLDIQNKDGRPASAALGNNLPATEVLKLIAPRKNVQDLTERLAYHEDFKAVHYINLHPAVETLAIENDYAYFDFGRRLYLKLKALKDKSDEPDVEIKDEVEINALYLFIGCANEEDFRQTYKVPPPPKKTVVVENTERIKRKETNIVAPNVEKKGAYAFPTDEGYFYYLFCYYSKRLDRVNKALVAIQNSSGKGPWDARQYGYHQPNEGAFDSIPFQGEAKISGQRLYINLESSTDSGFPMMQMNFIGLLEPLAKLDTNKIIPCSLQTVSIHAQYTILTEGYLLPCSFEEVSDIIGNPKKLMNSGIPLRTDEDGLTKEQLENLELYLMMGRKHFHLELNDDGGPMTDLDNLAIRKVPVSKFTERLKGTWRLWSFGLERSALIESKLVIGADGELFRTRFYPYIASAIKKGLSKEMIGQLATLSVSDEIRKEQLCVTTYSPKGDLMNMTCFDFDGLLEDEIADGIFLSVGYDRPNSNNNYKTNGPIGGYVVMRKVQPGEPDFEPQKIKSADVEAYIKGLGLENMLQRLRQLWKRKTQKKLVNLRLGAFAVCTHAEKGLLLIENEEAPYKGRYHLPGGMLKVQAKSIDDVLSDAFSSQTNLDPKRLKLWKNETDVLILDYGEGVKEKVHLVGVLYKGDFTDAPLPKGAFYINPRELPADKDKYTPFAWEAVKDYLKNGSATKH